ncbi:MAG TPA: cardiolipin synthase B, partial [Thermoanaerobaculia bacterium]
MTRLSRLVLLLALCAPAWSGTGCSVVSSIVGKEKRDLYKFDHPFTVEDPSFRRSLDNLGTAMVPGNEAELYKNGDEIFPAMTKDIREA